ncbi:MAG: TPR end-of-group domain-containing protein [Gemmataceae bacterium]
MAHSADDSSQTSGLLAKLAERPQADFEFEFYTRLLARVPDYPEVLAVQAAHYSRLGKPKEGLKVDQKLAQLRPKNPTAHYNLACRYAQLRQIDLALLTLRRALELGYADLKYIQNDEDWKRYRNDPRFRQLLKEFLSHPPQTSTE